MNGNGVELRRVTDHKPSRRWVDIAFVAQMLLNVIALALVIGLLFQVGARQIDTVTAQNNVQICAQHDLTVAIKKIGTKLGLPVGDIVPPSTEGIDCP